MTKNGQNMAKIEKIRKMQIIDNKEDKFFYFPMISMPCTGSGYSIILTDNDCRDFLFLVPFLCDAAPKPKRGLWGYVVLMYESFPGPFDFVGHRWGSGPMRLWELTIKGKIRDKRPVGRWG